MGIVIVDSEKDVPEGYFQASSDFTFTTLDKLDAIIYDLRFASAQSTNAPSYCVRCSDNRLVVYLKKE